MQSRWFKQVIWIILDGDLKLQELIDKEFDKLEEQYVKLIIIIQLKEHYPHTLFLI